ncbi:carbohydrate ABC transporter membrane protein 1, CUT1 family [Tistlia consotensis]|uniref:Carbohydrate ABC transporter membrane protein 1, CUT1 family n=1 Tax=Tistlia consotensis USBA 355 TaxID=560819 RepID=A0A1Y6C6M2_9PROT|nr:sugar ABC transporter permease [Tistlia consotensis]SMF38908.1 carbohydrate ABC transporter membrane protein 1, CUT1 family [Tistlia consotensis USBA 355]SNR36717.1 carbohydrate ABC transporter membrane protein 1, CUT1 family [Tistlia consotensis]
MRLKTSDSLIGVAFITPAATLFLLLVAYPLFQSILISFSAINTMTLKGHYVGLANYLDILQDQEFWRTLVNTLIWTAGSLVLQVLLGVGFALLLHRAFPGRALARSLVLFPYLLSTAVAVLVWRWLFNDLYGILNYGLVHIGLIERPIAWLSRMPEAMISVILVGAWKFFPFVVIALLARLQTIPLQLYEAARIDGASAVARFWDITLPQLSGVLAVVVLLRSIWDFKEFDLVYLMTGGGPGIGTQTLPILVYREAFPQLHLGKGAAIAVVMLLVMLVFMLLYLRQSARGDER